MKQFQEFVAAELKELESKDVDQLYGCIRDNLKEMGTKFNTILDNELYEEIESQLELLNHTIKTTVIFRKFKKEGDIIALFPYESWTNSECASYQHIGQHGGADYNYVISQTVPATSAEYKSLYSELTNQIGYNLNIAKRRHGKVG